MVRQLLGNIRGPRGPVGERGSQGPKGDDGSDVELYPFDGRNLIEVTHETQTSNGSVQVINGTDVFIATDSDTVTRIQYMGQYELKEGKTYVISFDYYSEAVENCDNIWIINTDGSHSNYSLHPENRFDYTNIYNIPLGEEIRCYVVFKPEYDLIGELRIGSNRNDGDTGPLEIKNVSLSEGYDISYKPKIYGLDRRHLYGLDTQYLYAWLRGEVTGSQSVPNIVRIAPVDGNIEVENDHIEMTAGLWSVNLDAYLNPVNYEGTVYVAIYKNEEQVGLMSMQGTSQKRGSVSQLIHTQDGDNITVRTYRPTSTTGDVSFGGTINNNIKIFKIGV